MKSCNIECLYILIDYNDTVISVVNTSDCLCHIINSISLRRFHNAHDAHEDIAYHEALFTIIYGSR